jgi:hypothetical protein
MPTTIASWCGPFDRHTLRKGRPFDGSESARALTPSLLSLPPPTICERWQLGDLGVLDISGVSDLWLENRGGGGGWTRIIRMMMTMKMTTMTMMIMDFFCIY